MTSQSLSRRTAVAEAIAEIWRSSTNPDHWIEALGAIHTLFPRTIGGTFYTPFRQGQPGGLWVNLNAPDGLIETYAKEMGAKDILLHAILRQFPSDGFVFSVDGLLPTEVLHASDIYRKWMLPFGIPKGVGLTAHATGQEAVLMSMGGAGWSKRDNVKYQETMEILRPHVHGSIAAHWRLVKAESQAQISRYALDELSLGIAWLSPDGRVVHSNKTAQAILEENDGLRLSKGHIMATDNRSSALLSAGITRLSGNVGEEQGASRSGMLDSVIAVPRLSGRPAYVVSLVPSIADPVGVSDGAVRVIAFLSDPARLPARVRGRLMELYGLTKSEAEVAEEIAKGMSVDELAERRQVSLNTVRTQVKSLMAKLGAMRQSDVVRAVMTLSSVGG